MDYDNSDMRTIGGVVDYNGALNQQPPEIAAQQYLKMMNSETPYMDLNMGNMPTEMQSNMNMMPTEMQSNMNMMPAEMQSNMNMMPADPVAGSGMNEDMQDFMSQGYLMGPNCFGAESQKYAQVLMQYINDEYRDSMYYTTLSRRATTGNARRLFRNIAADELKHSRRFASAYFLITGKRYFPTRSSVEAVVVPPSFVQALRERYMAESRDAIKYRQFANTTTDRCLKRMAMDTSDDERMHAQDILGLIQTMR